MHPNSSFPEGPACELQAGIFPELPRPTKLEPYAYDPSVLGAMDLSLQEPEAVP